LDIEEDVMDNIIILQEMPKPVEEPIFNSPLDNFANVKALARAREKNKVISDLKTKVVSREDIKEVIQCFFGDGISDISNGRNRESLVDAIFTKMRGE